MSIWGGVIILTIILNDANHKTRTSHKVKNSNHKTRTPHKVKNSNHKTRTPHILRREWKLTVYVMNGLRMWIQINE